MWQYKTSRGILNQTLKNKCLELQRKPCSDRVMKRVTRRENSDLANHVKEFCKTGQTYPFGFVRDKKFVQDYGAEYIVLRVVPKSMGIRFACACAKRVLAVVEKSYPKERGLRELIELVEAGPSRDITKKRIKEKLADVQRFTAQIDREGDAAFAARQFDHMSRSEIDKRYMPLLAIDVILAASGSIGRTRSIVGWLQCVDEAALRYVEFVSKRNGKRGKREARKWQLSHLIELVEQMDCKVFATNELISL